MKKRFLMMAAVAAMSAMMSMTAFAGMGSWQKNDTGWWWQRNDGSYPVSEWKWIDGNGDGTVESYYFDQNGYMMANTTTPDGYTVNANGAWVQDGVVQTRPVMLDLGDEVLTTQTVTQPATDGVVTDGKSIEQITLNQEIVGMMGAGGVDRLPNKTEIEWPERGTTYAVNYGNAVLRVETSPTANWVGSIYGPAKTVFNNFPFQGIELNAFYDNANCESNSAGRQVMASTGRSDTIFGLPGGSYRMAWGDVGETGISILLTAGSDGTWYIYPDSPVYLH